MRLNAKVSILDNEFDLRIKADTIESLLVGFVLAYFTHTRVIKIDSIDSDDIVIRYNADLDDPQYYTGTVSNKSLVAVIRDLAVVLFVNNDNLVERIVNLIYDAEKESKNIVPVVVGRN